MFKTHNTADINVNGTYLIGRVSATRRQLEAIFGSPMENGGEDKVTTEWNIKFDDGVVATIYDWKRYEMGPPGMDEVESWHIGGHRINPGDPPVARIHDLLRESLGLTARSCAQIEG